MKTAAVRKSEPHFDQTEPIPRSERAFHPHQHEVRAPQSRLKRTLNTFLAYASNREGLEGFQYLWAAPAAVGTVGLFFGLVALDQHLGGSFLKLPPLPTFTELAPGNPERETHEPAPSIMEAAYTGAAQIAATPETGALQRKQERSPAKTPPALAQDSVSSSLAPVQSEITARESEAAVVESEAVALDSQVAAAVSFSAPEVISIPDRTKASP
ncbi:MAG: hypothetical protein ACREV2_19885, partial [Burkholderiales bacterium]